MYSIVFEEWQITNQWRKYSNERELAEELQKERSLSKSWSLNIYMAGMHGFIYATYLSDMYTFVSYNI